METRDDTLKSLRPEIPSARVLPNTSEEERFQNEILRPIIRLQTDLLLAMFRDYVHQYKNVFYDLSVEERMDYIENAIQKDNKFRNSLKGVIIGQFTLDEYEEYSIHTGKLNRRITEIIKERLKSNIQLLHYQCA